MVMVMLLDHLMTKSHSRRYDGQLKEMARCREELCTLFFVKELD